MGYSLQDALQLLAEIEGLESTARAKRQTLKKALAEIHLPVDEEAGDAYLCPECGLRFKQPDRVTEHRENVHGIRVG